MSTSSTLRDRQLDALANQILDLQRQLEDMRNRDVGPIPSSIVTYSGTPVANRLAYWTGGDTVAAPSTSHVTSGGSVTIGGTVVPEKAFQVQGDIYLAPVPYNANGFYVKDSGGTARLFLAVSAATTNAIVLQSAGNGLLFRSSAAATHSRVTDGGDWGFGTATPGDRVHVLHSTDGGITVEHDNVGIESPWLHVKKSTNEVYLAVAGTTNSWFTGAAQGDTALRANNGKRILLGVDNGAGTAAPTVIITADALRMERSSNTVDFALAMSSNAFFTGAATGDQILRGMNGKLVLLGVDNGSGNASPSLAVAASKAIAGGLLSAGATSLGVKAGSSSNDAAVGGVLYVGVGTVGNVGTGEDNLDGYVVPANTLSANNMSLWFVATGKGANNGNTKTVRVYFGGTNIFQFSLPTSVAVEWEVRAHGIRTGASAMKWSSFVLTRSVGVGTVVGSSMATTAVSLASNQTLQFTGEATSNNDVTQESVVLEWKDANT